jgi:cobalt-zinc-cadmium efflux system outer membrane protein
MNRLKRRVWFVLSLAGLLAPHMFAQTTYTWEELRDKFRQTNPTLLADQVNIDEARASEITAFLRPNPDLTISADQFTIFKTPQTAYQPLAGVDQNGSVSYLIERQKKRYLRRESAEGATKVAVSTHSDLERTMISEFRTAFINALQAKAMLALAKDNMAYYDKVIEVSRERFKVGDISKVDLARIELQRAQFQSDLVNDEVNLRTAKIALLTLLNDRTPVEKFGITGPFDFKDGLEPLADLRQIALGTRPDLKAAAQAIVKADADHRLAISNGTADPTISFDVGRDPPLPSYVGFSVSFPLRIFDRNQGEKLRTKLEIDRTVKARAGAEAQVLSDVDSAYATVESTLQLLRPYKATYLPQAVEVREIITFSYQRGGAALLDFLDAQKEYRDTQLAYLTLIGSYLTAANQLNTAVGREVIQ